MTGEGDTPDLRAENARLVALLDSHGIEWRRTAEVDVQPAASALSTVQRFCGTSEPRAVPGRPLVA